MLSFISFTLRGLNNCLFYGALLFYKVNPIIQLLFQTRKFITVLRSVAFVGLFRPNKIDYRDSITLAKGECGMGGLSFYFILKDINAGFFKYIFIF